MDDIRRVLRSASRRLLVIDVLRTLAVSATVMVAVLLVVLIADRALTLTIPWSEVAWWSLGLTAAAGVLWAVAARARELEVARVVDDRAGLKETLSTALCVEREADGWSRAVVETARERAQRVVVRDALPIRAPSFWPVPAGAALAFAVAFFLLPEMDLRGRLAEARDREIIEQEVIEARTEVERALAQTEEILAKSNVELGMGEEAPEALEGQELGKAESPEEIRKEALRKLTNMTEKLGDKLSGDDAKKMEALDAMLRQLRTPGQGPMTELSRQLARGNFGKAKEELNKLAKQVAEGSLTPEEKAKAKEQLEQLSKQLESLGQQQAGAEQALRAAGLSAEQAKQAMADPETLKKALEQMQNLSEEQKQQLQQQLQTMAEACKQCNGIGQAMSQMAQGMSQQGMSQSGMQAMDNLAGQLSEMEMTAAEMQNLDAAMQQAMQSMAKLSQQLDSQSWAQCNGMGNSPGQGQNGPWRPGQSQGQGSGSGGPGQGNGDGPEGQATDFMLKAEKSPTQLQGGPVIGTRLVYGDQVRGESVQEFDGAVERGLAQATNEALTENLVPREYHDAVKHYFGRLEERVQAAKQSPAPASDEKK